MAGGLAAGNAEGGHADGVAGAVTQPVIRHGQEGKRLVCDRLRVEAHAADRTRLLLPVGGSDGTADGPGRMPLGPKPGFGFRRIFLAENRDRRCADGGEIAPEHCGQGLFVVLGILEGADVVAILAPAADGETVTRAQQVAARPARSPVDGTGDALVVLDVQAVHGHAHADSVGVAAVGRDRPLVLHLATVAPAGRKTDVPVPFGGILGSGVQDVTRVVSAGRDMEVGVPVTESVPGVERHTDGDQFADDLFGRALVGHGGGRHGEGEQQECDSCGGEG